jgi:hypothetical protein
MLTTILAYVIAAVGLATILAGGWSLVMLAIQDERDRPFRHYAVAIAMLAGSDDNISSEPASIPPIRDIATSSLLLLFPKYDACVKSIITSSSLQEQI